ncbi:SpoIID/LytB domain-containing protein [Mesobacillus jeotgali]|uniref:SpoIID/LytB domain-containing protein n=1 Tax=Mesobacillus jeotgali TaxID=129985 RepID=A0ABY9VHL9_9BACI|nr:SpoIID/LytB domain-containing protein [Mesobacillus jeotgali]WNF22634.1 SpoIID/LytB domain-containing protein [Mesobacillus jeotgali]
MRKHVGWVVSFFALILILSSPISTKANSLISVNITQNGLSSKNTINLTIYGDYIVSADQRELSGNYQVKIVNGDLYLYTDNGHLIKNYGSTFSIYPTVYGTKHYLSLNGYSYLGEMSFTESGGVIKPRNTLTIEDYLKGVVPKEMSALKPMEALKAQAVAARTYVTGYLNNTNINDTISYQVYGGYAWHENSTKAVEDTKGIIITHNGSSIKQNAFFYSSNGGMMLTNQNSWGTNALAYFNFGKDDYDLTSSNPYKDWNYNVYKSQIGLAGRDMKNPAGWWDTVTEKDLAFMNKVKSFLQSSDRYKYGDAPYVPSEYEMKITTVKDISFTTNLTSRTEVLTGELTVQYILKRRSNNTFVMDENGNLKIHELSFRDRSYDIRSLVGSSKMKSPYIKSVNKSRSDYFIVNGGGFGHGIGMSQYGAYKMAETKSYAEILAYYFPGTRLYYDSSLVYVPPVKMQSVSPDVLSPQSINKTINITATATGGSELLYSFHMFDGNEWTTVKEYSVDNTFSWTPTKPGNYKFSVHVKDRFSSKTYDSYGTLEYSIQGEPVKLNHVTLSKTSPQDVGTAVTFTADASGGVNRLYKFWIFDGQEWKVLSEYSTDNQATWTPTEAGDYRFSVHVKDSLSTNEYDDYAGFEFTAVQPPDITSLKADRPSPQAVGNTVTITAKGVGVQEALYRFYQYDGKEWTVLKDYGPENTIQWSPRAGGTYRISVHMKDSQSTKDYDTYKWFDYNFYVAPVKVSSLQASLPSPQPSGKTITLTANASGGTEKLYKFHAYDGKAWKVLRDYQASNQYAWTPIPGNYKLVVHVKDKNSTKAYDAYTSADYQVSDSPVQMEALNTSYASPQTAGTPVRITAQAIGGTDRRYAFHVYDGSAWTELQSYSSDNEYTWIPSKPGSYKFSVHVKDAKSTKRYDDYGTFEYQVLEGVKMVSVETDKASPQAANTTINVTATGKGGTERLYAFHVYDGKEWKLVQGYSANNQYSWKPTAAGNYKFSIHVKDKNSTRTYDDYGVLLYEVK